MTEKEFSLSVVNRLSKHFNFQEEVWSLCGKYRIDYVAQHKFTGSLFGLEFKQLNKKRGEEIGEYIIQASGYSRSVFGAFGNKLNMPILICPPLSYNYLICRDGEPIIAENEFGVKCEYFKDRHQKNHDHHTVNGMLGAFGVGEVRSEVSGGDKYLKFVISNKILWSELKVNSMSDLYTSGLHSKNYERYSK